jgi:hypothetical protein
VRRNKKIILKILSKKEGKKIYPLCGYVKQVELVGPAGLFYFFKASV